MARPQKKGLDYFPLDVTMDKTDSDIEILEAKYKNGFLVLIKLYMKIYQNEGYFIKWDEKESLLLSKRVNSDFNEVNSIINDLVEWNVFNCDLFKKFNILTSKRIQETYIDAVKKRKSVDMIDSLMLTKLINGNINLVNSDIYPQSKVNKSKVNKSKEDVVHSKTNAPPQILIAETLDVEERADRSKKRTKREITSTQIYDKEILDICNAFYFLLPENARKDISEKTKLEWKDTIHKLKNLDGYSYEEIAKIIQWAKKDNFWKDKFYSLTKLRKKSKTQDIKFITMFENDMKKGNGGKMRKTLEANKKVKLKLRRN